MCDSCDDKPVADPEERHDLLFLSAGFPRQEGESVDEVIRAYQEHHDLHVDGWIGRITERHLRDQAAGRVCAVAERMSGNRRCRWDNTNWNGRNWIGPPRRLLLRWGVTNDVEESMIDSLKWAWSQWEEHLAIRAEHVENRGGLDVFFTHKRIDGPSGTLAWAQLPCGPDRQLESRIDASESWHLDPNTVPARGRIHLGGVMCHEIGHLLGLDHIPTSRGRALLNPTYGPDVLTPQPLDIAEGVVRYGPAADVRPGPEPTPDPPAGDDTLRVTVSRGAARYEGTLARTA